MSDLLVVKVKSGVNVKPDVMRHWYKEILRQKKAGVVVLPWFLDAVVVPENTEVQMEEGICESCVNDDCIFQSEIKRTECEFYIRGSK